MLPDTPTTGRGVLAWGRRSVFRSNREPQLVTNVPTFSIRWLMVIIATTCLTGIASTAFTDDSPSRELAPSKLPSVEEARGRARLLHEAVHATLQVVHLEYYREDESLELPAATLKLVFRELAERHKVELRWLAVNAEAMNVEHKPRDAFEAKAVEVLASGKDEYEAIAEGSYRLASTITLSSDCLKCHLPNRRSNKARAAGLVIAMPVSK